MTTWQIIECALMLAAGVIVHIAKKTGETSVQTGKPWTIRSYSVAHVNYLIILLVSAGAGFVILLDRGELSVYSAFLMGITANSFADSGRLARPPA